MAKKAPPDTNHGSGRYVKEIIKCLERVCTYSGARPATVFDDWLVLTRETLAAIPDTCLALARGETYRDPPEVAEQFAQVRSRYQGDRCYGDRWPEVWSAFGQAFAILTESAAPGLAGYGYDSGYMGPDVLGHTYMVWAAGDPSWNAQYFTQWNVALMMAQMVNLQSEREIYDRIKKACLHPENILGQAAVMAGLMCQDGPQAQEWFINHIAPAAAPFYEPLVVADPAGCGSGILLLAAASTFPAWMVQRGYVTFQGIDKDLTSVNMAKANFMLYGLNGFGLKLTAAAAELLRSRQKKTPAQLAAPDAKTVADDHQPPVMLPTFEEVFRLREPAVEVVT